MQQKLAKLSHKLKTLNLDSFLISEQHSVYYFTGFKGLVAEDRETFLIFKSQKLHLIVPRLYQFEAKKLDLTDLTLHVVEERDHLIHEAAKLLSQERSAGFEPEDLNFQEYKTLTQEAKNTKFIDIPKLVIEIREIKTEDEINLVRKAQEITYKSLKNILPSIKAGMTETDVKEILVKEMKTQGAEGESFPAIVAAGKNSSVPHQVTSDAKLKLGDMVLIDWGAKYKGYCGDSTRMVFLGKPPADEHTKIYNLVRRAQENAIKNIKSGTACAAAFDLANSVFKKEKAEANFTHGLGHGIGLATHEEPYLRNSSEKLLQEGMVFSIEPGLYYPKWGGIRIEDLVVCRKDKVEVLGGFSKEIIVI